MRQQISNHWVQSIKNLVSEKSNQQVVLSFDIVTHFNFCKGEEAKHGHRHVNVIAFTFTKTLAFAVAQALAQGVAQAFAEAFAQAFAQAVAQAVFRQFFRHLLRQFRGYLESCLGIFRKMHTKLQLRLLLWQPL